MTALCLCAAPRQTEPPSPAAAVASAWADARRLGDDAHYFRYFRVTTTGKDYDDFLVAFSLHLNLLSTKGVIKHPTPVAPYLLRIDVRDYGWEDKLGTWEQLAKFDFVYHQKAVVQQETIVRQYWPGGLDPQKGKHYDAAIYRIKKQAGDVIDVHAVWLGQEDVDGLRKTLYTEAPIVDAEWFFVQSARQTSLQNDDAPGVGYNDWLGIKSRDDFLKLTGTDRDVAKRVFAEWRAVVDRSGISVQNRQIVAFGGASGKAWGTLDTFAQKGRGVAKRNLRDGEFAHDAEEWIGRLGNGLWVTGLFDKNGKAQASAPDKIGPDDSALNKGRDHRVHANLSCIRCHWTDKDGLKPVNDWARKTFRSSGVLRLADYDKKVLLELESQYLRDLDEVLDDERRLFARAIGRATASKLHPKGLTMAAAAKLYAETWDRYVLAPVTLESGSLELGVAASTLKSAIGKHAKIRGQTDLVLAGFLDGQSLTRLEWEDSWPLAAALAAGIDPPELTLKEKK